MSNIKIKICGITRIQDAEYAVRLGADAIGVILSTDSPRKIDLAQAAQIRRYVPESVDLVGVFVDESKEFIEQACEQIGLDVIQLHGAESAGFASSLQLPYIRAVRAQSRPQVQQEVEDHSAARAILIDPYVKGIHGGTGQQLDLRYWPASFEPPMATDRLILAGGLNPSNAAQRVAEAQAKSVDLSSGVEAAPGIKSMPLMQALFAALRP